jgi:hypothetical protein
MWLEPGELRVPEHELSEKQVAGLTAVDRRPAISLFQDLAGEMNNSFLWLELVSRFGRPVS